MFQFVEYTNQFKRDYKKAKSRHYDMNLINSVIEKIIMEEPLPTNHKAHKLAGNYKGFWECHILPDWLLIWTTNTELNTVYFVRTGTHSDLF